MSESIDLRQLEQDLGGRYQIVRELGRGAFGTVFLAREIALHRLVAIKALHRERVVSAEERERFTREARTIGQLSHPGIVPLLTFGETPAVLYMVMPYVGGESLATVLRDSRRLDPDDARRILIEIADAVAYAHGQGVLHRDIKPENVLLESPPPGDDAPPRVRLIDFGVAAFPMRDRGAGATYDTWGTPNFMAPEQALGEPELDPRSELYSIGVLGYLLLTGQLPFDSTKPSARLVQQRSEPAVPLARRAPGAPADLVTTIDRCLAFEPERRWVNARELRNALMRGLDATVPTVSLARQALRGRRPVRRTNRSRSTLVSESISAVHFTGLANDARFSFRRLRKTPGFTAAMILTLATGIGATTVVFSLFEALVLRAPALPNPGSLVVLEERHNDGHSMEMGATSFAYERYLAYAAALPTVFTGLVGQTIRDFSLRSGTDVRTVGGLVTSGNYFEVLGIRPALGRFYTGSQDSAGGAEPVVVIGYDFWQRELRGDRGVLGRSIVLDSRPMTIIGVAPRGFHGAFAGIYAFDAWVPVAAYRQSPRATPASSPRPIGVVVFGRLRPGLSAEQAHVALRVAFPRIPMRNPSSHVLDAWVEPLHALTPDSRGATAGFMTMLLAIACVVLFIAATNTAGMLLARATILRREIATRLAVGATRLRLVQQLVVESLILCALAGAIALLITTWSVRVFNAMPSPMPWALELNFSVNMRVFLFAALAVLGAGLLAGLAPAFHATRVDLAAAMKEGGMQSTVPRARLRSAFVVAQIVLSVTLLTVAALFVRSLQRALTIDPGFDAAGVVAGSLDLRPHGYDDKRLVTLLNGLLVRHSGRPEIESASFAADPPPSR
ncbi:MAG: hypothetical protein DMD26_16510 [Gemmatimonadetes bacterium]|nr:MAG: hypothetical protein DMD26_16510 [Gemmatimonadota bacterium]